MTRFANTPQPPYYAVIFSSQRTEPDQGYSDMADHMMALASQQAGYLGAESARDAAGFGILVRTLRIAGGQGGAGIWHGLSYHELTQPSQRLRQP